MGLQFSTAITDVTPKYNSAAKTLILSAWDDAENKWYSQTNTKANPKIHTLGEGETYWKIYEVVVSSNYNTFTADQKAEIDYELTQSAGSQYGKKFVCSFAGKAVADPITHVASCFLLGANDMSASTAPTGVTEITFNLRDWAATSGQGSLNHGSVTKYLIVYVDGTAGDHTGTVVAGVTGTANVTDISNG